MPNVAAIYHFTDGEKRLRVSQKQLNILEHFAISQGFSVGGIYCDKSILKCEQSEFDRFMSDIDKYDVLITKDFYHISKNTMKCMSVMKYLRDKGIQIHSIENGSFTWEEEPFDKQLRVATYCCRFGAPNEMKEIIPVHNDILKLFANKKTRWSVVDQFFDESEYQKDGEQIQLMELIKNKYKYDLLLVHNLNDVHWRTATFCKVREQLHLDIFSLQEGYLRFH